MRQSIINVNKLSLILAGCFTLLFFTVHAGFCSPLEEDELARLVEKNLPTWGPEILKIRNNSKPWSQKLSFEQVFSAMNDKTIRVEKIPRGATKLSDENKVVHLDLQRGKVKYVNRQRAWDFHKHRNTKALDKEQAVKAVELSLEKLEFPTEELGKPQLDIQVAAGAPVGSKTIKDKFEMYRIVTFNRRIGELPVYGSKVRYAITNEAEVQRAQLKWPDFRLQPKLSLMERKRVIKQIVRKIMAQEPEQELKVKATLAYSQSTTDDEEFWFVPSVIVSVYSPPTPYQLVVPLVR